MDGLILVEKEGKKQYCKTLTISDFSKVTSLNNKVRQKIIRYLAKKPAYASKLAEILKINEQTVYYHFRILEKSGFIYEIERKQIRGTIAKKYTLKKDSFSIIFNENAFKQYETDEDLKKETPSILFDFISNGVLDAQIVVGSPQPHGPHKSTAKDGHHAIDIGVFLGNYSVLPNESCVSLDVGIDLKKTKNLIIVGGPVTNLLCYKINKYLPCKFSDKRPWGIKTKKDIYTDDSVGMIAKIKNPFFEDGNILVIAGIRGIGTKSAVIAITRNLSRIMNNKKNEENFYSIVQGYDLDADGKIDSIEVLE